MPILTYQLCQTTEPEYTQVNTAANKQRVHNRARLEGHGGYKMPRTAHHHVIAPQTPETQCMGTSACALRRSIFHLRRAAQGASPCPQELPVSLRAPGAIRQQACRSAWRWQADQLLLLIARYKLAWPRDRKSAHTSGQATLRVLRRSLQSSAIRKSEALCGRRCGVTRNMIKDIRILERAVQMLIKHATRP